MNEYIKKEDIEQKIQDGLNNLVLGYDAIEVLGMIYEMPAADVAQVRHGRWKCHGDCGVTECSACGWSIEEYVGDYSYCPNCGAKIDGGADNGLL